MKKLNKNQVDKTLVQWKNYYDVGQRQNASVNFAAYIAQQEKQNKLQEQLNYKQAVQK